MYMYITEIKRIGPYTKGDKGISDHFFYQIFII